MKIIAIERELKTPPGNSATELYKQEAKQVYTLYLQEMIREIYMTEAYCAILVLECESLEQARQALDTLPLVQSGMIAFDVHELHPYPGYGRLMKE
jgi:hypothetical protein